VRPFFPAPSARMVVVSSLASYRQEIEERASAVESVGNGEKRASSGNATRSCGDSKPPLINRSDREFRNIGFTLRLPICRIPNG